MKIYIKNIGIAVLLLSSASSANAVDGYKNLKFGMTEAQVKASNICNFESGEKDSNGITTLTCFDFLYGNSNRIASAFIYKNKLYRFTINIPIESAFPVINQLSKKYGGLSSRSTHSGEWKKLDDTPNFTAEAWFDNNTICESVTNDQNLEKMVLLTYTARSFAEIK